MSGSLSGLRVIVGRQRPADLMSLLEARGAEAVHVPLIAVRDPEDGGAALERELGRLDRYDWLVVTSAPGAERVGAAAGDCSSIRLAAVGPVTAGLFGELAGRAVDLVPSRHLSSELARELIGTVSGPQTVLVAAADRSDGLVAEMLRGAGHDVTSVIAYRTVLTPPDPAAVQGADALLLTSGSAAQSWVTSVPPDRSPGVIVAIGPTTARAAERHGLRVAAVAREHTLSGLVEALEEAVSATGP
jgi:uroporphyrinogen-III synthase